MLTCKEFDDFMIDFLDHELPLMQRIMCWLHVRICRDCASFVRQYRQSIALGKKAYDNADAAVPDSVPEPLLKAALAYSKKHQRNN